LNKNTYYISPYVEFEDTLFEILNNNYELNDFEQYECFDFIYKSDKFTAQTLNKNRLNMEQVALIQIFSCIINKPNIVCIDSFWIDLDSEKINQAIEILLSNSEKQIIIAFTTKNSEKEIFDKVYNIN
jgi:hypothetical protein